MKINSIVNNFRQKNYYYQKYGADKQNRSLSEPSFLGYTVHIADGGFHADIMKHFAHALSPDMDIEMHYVKNNTNCTDLKQLDDLEQKLKDLNSSKKSFEDEYIAVPALALIPILQLQYEYARTTGIEREFTPQNLKDNKKFILDFLKEIYEHPDKHKECIEHMDHDKIGIRYVYGVIEQINQLIKKGAEVYVPSGHPQDDTIKWMAGERGLKPELYYYISSGKDTNGAVSEMRQEVRDKNWYNVNLLALSDAHIIGITDASGKNDYIFADYGSCVTGKARGVYNFSPVRKNGVIEGYSFTDTSTNQYPAQEFPKMERTAVLNKFTGRELNEETLADAEEIRQLLRCRHKSGDTEKLCADKLYPVSKVFTLKEQRALKTNLRGRYTDRSLTLFFDVNRAGKIIFPACDCEGSGKPSVMSMWGSCFSVFNAIAGAIKNKDRHINIIS